MVLQQAGQLSLVRHPHGLRLAQRRGPCLPQRQPNRVSPIEVGMHVKDIQ